MGIEYKLEFSLPEADVVVSVLGNLEFVRNAAEPDAMMFERRTSRDDRGMPDACVRVESYGLYYCDYGGDGRAILGQVISKLVSSFGAVTVSDLE